MRVLVVDDFRHFADAVCRLLTSLGYEAASCIDPKQCVELAMRFGPDVVFLDIAMSGIDGFQLLRQIRERSDLTCRIIALTGHTDSMMQQQCLAAGFDAFLAKPPSTAEIEAVLGAPHNSA